MPLPCGRGSLRCYAFPESALVLVVLLPTTFWRAALVAFLHSMIVFVIAFVAVGAVFLALDTVGP